MLTPEEYITEKPQVAWLNGLEVLEHCLNADYRETIYKDPHPAMGRLDELREELERHSKEDEFSEIEENVFYEDYHILERSSETGDLNIDRYLDRDERCFDEYVKVLQEGEKDAVSVIMDMSIPWTERDAGEMEKRHHDIYKIVLQCEADQIPCRVVAVYGSMIPERKKVLKFYIVIKDYNDPIFPGLWGAFKTNKTTNNFGNVVMDFLVGTEHSGNGTPTPISIGDDIEDDELILIRTKRVHA